MLKLKQLKFSGIGRFVEEQTIDFTLLGNLVQVDGLRTDTGGSSGSGKSTTFHSLDYLLGMNDVPTTVLQSRYTKDGMSVTGTFDYDGRPLEITRGKSKLIVDLDGEKTTGSKLAEEKIDEILGMPRDLFRKILHKRQKEGGFFLQFTPAKTFEFLTDALNLAKVRDHLDIVDNKIKELNPKLEKSASELGRSNASLTATQSALSALGSIPVSDMTQERVLALKHEHEAAETLAAVIGFDLHRENDVLGQIKSTHLLNSQALELSRPKLLGQNDLPEEDLQPLYSAVRVLEAVKLAHVGETRDLEAFRPTLDTSQPDLSALNSLENDLSKTQAQKIEAVRVENERVYSVKSSISDINLLISNLNHKISQGVQAKSEAVKLAGEVKKIRESLCPTCEQGWATDNAKAKEAQLLEKIKEYKDLIRIGAESESLVAQKTAELNALIPLAQFVTPPAILDLDTKEQALKVDIQKEKVSNSSKVLAQNEQNKSRLAEFSQKQRDLMVKQSTELQAAEASLKSVRDFISASVTQKNTVRLAEFSQKQKDLTATQTTELDAQNKILSDINAKREEASKKWNATKSQLDLATQTFKSHMDALYRHNESLTILKSQEKSAQSEIIKWEAESKEHSANLELAEEAKKAVKSYLSCSFDDALEAIGDSATRIIRGIPNMANATISLEGVRETKDGRVKEEVNAVISMDGEEGIPIKSLSGGERSSVDLAVDLAVIDLLEAKSGKGCDLFILDEAFIGMDTTSIEQALEVLKNSNLTKRLVIVEHNPIVSQMVTDKIMVHRDGQFSRIVQ